jgi:glutamate racemase
MGTFGDVPGQIDTLVLGCTHYVFVEELLRQMVGPTVNIISTGTAVARQAHRLSAIPTQSSVESKEAPHNTSPDTIQLWTTGSLSALEHAADRWLSLPPQCCHWIAPSAP